VSPAERIVDADPTEVITRRQGPRLQDGARLVYTVVAPAAITVPAPASASVNCLSIFSIPLPLPIHGRGEGGAGGRQ